MIELPEDFRDLLVELSRASADFVVVGGYAVAFHGHPRATKDLDIFVRPSRANAERVYRALGAFGAPVSAFEVSPADFEAYDGVLQIGVPPFRIDVLNQVKSVTFDEAVADGCGFDLEGHRVPVIGRAASSRTRPPLLARKRMWRRWRRPRRSSSESGCIRRLTSTTSTHRVASVTSATGCCATSAAMLFSSSGGGRWRSGCW